MNPIEKVRLKFVSPKIIPTIISNNTSFCALIIKDENPNEWYYSRCTWNFVEHCWKKVDSTNSEFTLEEGHHFEWILMPDFLEILE